MKNKKFFIYPLITAFLIFISYPKISLFPFAFISFVPYIHGLFEINNAKSSVKYGFLSGFFIYLFLLYWIYPTLRAGSVNVFISILSTLLLPTILSFEFIIITYLSWQAKNFGSNMFLVVFPSVFVSLDFIKNEITRFAVYFPWFEIGYSQWNNHLILPLAYVGQSYLITFITVLVNGLAGVSILRKTQYRKTKIATAFIIIIISHTAGYYLKNRISDEISKTNQHIKISVIQPSVDLYMKWNSLYEETIKTRIEKLISKASEEKPDIIIWPENALYGWIDDKDVFDWLCRNIKDSKSYHIVGSVSRNEFKYVSLYLISPECEFLYAYNKRILVPFGEYVPMRKFLGKYISVIGSLGEFEKGDYEQKNMIFKNSSIATSICYETLFRHLFYPSSDIDLIINITNDGWYLNTSAPYQHFAISVIRAVENRRVFVRAANNGISAFIYPDGTVKKILNLNEINTLTHYATVLKIQRPNVYERYLVVVISLMIVFAFLLSLPLKN